MTLVPEDVPAGQSWARSPSARLSLVESEPLHRSTTQLELKDLGLQKFLAFVARILVLKGYF
jgi:hypothetical protein